MQDLLVGPEYLQNGYRRERFNDPLAQRKPPTPQSTPCFDALSRDLVRLNV
jgi:hypothetical protein